MTRANLVQLHIVQEAADLVDASGVAELTRGWESVDQKYRGGRKSTMSTRTVLIAWLVVALEESPLHLKRVSEVLSERLYPPPPKSSASPRSFATPKLLIFTVGSTAPRSACSRRSTPSRCPHVSDAS